MRTSTSGATLLPIARSVALAPRSLAQALASGGVTTAFVTTALFNAVAREAPAAFRGCTQLLFGGEAVEPRWVRQVLEAGAPARLVHVYGPTEATTFATWHEVDAADARGATIPIGRPIANTEVLILDSEGEPVPVGVPGEIHLGGPGLALGYLGAEELTAERFVPHPFPRESAAKLYRTGDRARLRADGAIEFLGRADRQVKIRGHRIELGEIETAIGALPYVRVPRPLVATTPMRLLIETPDKQNANLEAALALPLNDTHPDYAAMVLANHVFGAGGSSRLWKRIRETEGLSYDVRSFIEWSSFEPNSRWVSSAIFAPANRARVETAWREELARSVKDGFTQAELDEARASLLAFRRLARAQDAAMAGLAVNDLYLGRTFAFAQQVDERLAAVTLEQLNTAWRRYIAPERMAVAWGGDFKGEGRRAP